MISLATDERPGPDDLPEPSRIMLVRLSAVGDCVHTLPLLHALREEWPNAHIGWVTQPAGASLLAGHPDVDEVIVINRADLTRWRGLAAIRSRLQSFAPDVCLDPQSLTKSGLVTWLSGAATRIGFARPHGRELAPWAYNRAIPAQKIHVVERYLELLRGLGVSKAIPPRFNLPIPEVAHDTAVHILRDTHMPSGGFALINCGAGWPSKLWPTRRFARIARHLGTQYQLPSLVVWHGDQEEKRAQDVARRGGGHAVAAPSTTLPVLAALARDARIVIASDTGPLHLAAAVGTCCIGLYGPTDGNVCGPYVAFPNQHHVVVESRDRDRLKSAKSPKNHAMLDVDVARVCQACDQLLQWQSGQALSAA